MTEPAAKRQRTHVSDACLRVGDQAWAVISTFLPPTTLSSVCRTLSRASLLLTRDAHGTITLESFENVMQFLASRWCTRYTRVHTHGMFLASHLLQRVLQLPHVRELACVADLNATTHVPADMRVLRVPGTRWTHQTLARVLALSNLRELCGAADFNSAVHLPSSLEVLHVKEGASFTSETLARVLALPRLRDLTCDVDTIRTDVIPAASRLVALNLHVTRDLYRCDLSGLVALQHLVSLTLSAYRADQYVSLAQVRDIQRVATLRHLTLGTCMGDEVQEALAQMDVSTMGVAFLARCARVLQCLARVSWDVSVRMHAWTQRPFCMIPTLTSVSAALSFGDVPAVSAMPVCPRMRELRLRIMESSLDASLLSPLLERMPNLRTLQLPHTQSLACLRHTPRLEHLTASVDELCAEDVARIQALHSLQSLDLHANLGAWRHHFPLRSAQQPQLTRVVGGR